MIAILKTNVEGERKRTDVNVMEDSHGCVCEYNRAGVSNRRKQILEINVNILLETMKSPAR